jgi:hypothetical protein
MAILPQTMEDAGLLPNRSLSMWSYTDPSDPHITWGKSHILVEAELDAPMKFGFPNPRGWLAYWWNGMLFVKRTKYEAQAAYYDLGCSHEFYCSNRFAELETLGPIQTIPPGQSITHTETWELHNYVDRPRSDNDARALAERLGLG